jgi:DNA polymerase-3 subunit alpha
VNELRSALTAHKGDVPVRIVVCHDGKETPLAVDSYPVAVSSALLGELKAIRGITVSA